MLSSYGVDVAAGSGKNSRIGNFSWTMRHDNFVDNGLEETFLTSSLQLFQELLLHTFKMMLS
jgi:hypothetical protein